MVKMSDKENLSKIKKDLDKDFMAYSFQDSKIYTYSISLFYEIYVKFIHSQEFSNRINKHNLKIFDIDIIGESVRLIFFVKKLEVA